MTFSEKLFKLRKEKGYSQEALAEKLNTSRQAISKWENGQGFPETEKLLIMGNIFEVSMDYLLKDTTEEQHENEEGYYVSMEMAEGFLIHSRKQAKYIASGFCLLILSIIPYLVFKQEPAIYTPIIIILVMLGIGTLVTSGVIEDDRYNILKKEVLLLDHNYLKGLTNRYESIKKRYAVILVFGICLIFGGGIPFLFEKKNITSGDLEMFYPYAVGAIVIGLFLFIQAAGNIDTYKLLVKNEEHTNRLKFKLMNRLKRKIDSL